MSITNLHVFSVLREKMNWIQARQGILAENVANAETPGYRARDLKELDFDGYLMAKGRGEVVAVRTNEKHITNSGLYNGSFRDRNVRTFETTPEGNSVVLEEEMMKVTANQMDYQAVTTLYQRSIKLLKTAIGKGR